MIKSYPKLRHFPFLAFCHWTNNVLVLPTKYICRPSVYMLWIYFNVKSSCFFCRITVVYAGRLLVGYAGYNYMKSNACLCVREFQESNVINSWTAVWYDWTMTVMWHFHESITTHLCRGTMRDATVCVLAAIWRVPETFSTWRHHRGLVDMETTLSDYKYTNMSGLMAVCIDSISSPHLTVPSSPVGASQKTGSQKIKLKTAAKS